MIEAKAKHITPVDENEDEDAGERSNVVDLVAALRQSLQQNLPAKTATKPVAKKRRA